MSVKSKIEELLEAALHPQVLQVENESHKHNVPKGSETHFKVTVAAETFTGKKLLERHRLVYKAVEEPMKNGVHALAVHAFTPEEWEKTDAAKASPPCLGGEKRK